MEAKYTISKALGFELSSKDGGEFVESILPIIYEAWKSVEKSNLVSLKDFLLVLNHNVARNTLFHLVHCINEMSKIPQYLHNIKMRLDNLEEEEGNKKKDFQPRKTEQEKEDIFKQVVDQFMEKSEQPDERRFLCPNCSLKFLVTIDSSRSRVDLSILDNFLYLLEQEFLKSVKPPIQT